MLKLCPEWYMVSFCVCRPSHPQLSVFFIRVTMVMLSLHSNKILRHVPAPHIPQSFHIHTPSLQPPLKKYINNQIKIRKEAISINHRFLRMYHSLPLSFPSLHHTLVHRGNIENSYASCSISFCTNKFIYKCSLHGLVRLVYGF